MKLIKLNESHYIIVDDSEIKEGDIFIHPDNVIERASRDLDGRGISKIIASTNKLNGVIFLNLSEVKELIGEVDVWKKAEEMFPYQETRTDFATDECRKIYKSGYNQALEDNKGKVYTEEDIIKVVRLSLEDAEKSVLWSKEYPQKLADKILQSLQPPTSWYVTFVDGKLKLK